VASWQELLLPQILGCQKIINLLVRKFLSRNAKFGVETPLGLLQTPILEAGAKLQFSPFTFFNQRRHWRSRLNHAQVGIMYCFVFDIMIILIIYCRYFLCCL